MFFPPGAPVTRWELDESCRFISPVNFLLADGSQSNLSVTIASGPSSTRTTTDPGHLAPGIRPLLHTRRDLQRTWDVAWN